MNSLKNPLVSGSRLLLSPWALQPVVDDKDILPVWPGARVCGPDTFPQVPTTLRCEGSVALIASSLRNRQWLPSLDE